MSVLKARRLEKAYKKRSVVQGIDIDVGSGEVVGLLGPNGAGKTTTFYMIAGLIPADSGTISIDKHQITDLPMHARAQLGIGYLAQEPSVFRRLSVRDNILAILETRKELTAEQQIKKCDHLLQDFSLSHITDNLAMSLSGGERRRLEIARALSVEPRFILLDEPFAGVDPISVVDIQKIITLLSQRGIGILITDHNVRETLGICDHAYILNEGKLIAAGKPEEILAHKEVREVYLGHDFTL